MNQQKKSPEISQESGAVRRRGPGSRADSSHPTYLQLMAAGALVADRDGLAAMSVSGVTKQAGLAKGTFYVHFADRTALIVAIHTKFHDQLFADVVAATSHLQPGAPRAAARIEAFLEGCLRKPGVRSLLLQSRHEQDIRVQVERRNREAALLLTAELRHGNPTGHEPQTARLLVAATIEVAGAELEANKRLPKLRTALRTFVDS